MNLTPPATTRQNFVRFMGFAWLVLSVHTTAWADLAVGRVTLLAGTAWRINASQQKLPLAEDALIYEGDTLLTGTSSLLHLRFDDGARLGLREVSELKVNTYRAEPAAIELELNRGTVRQISGDIAKKTPQSFKLKTPIAAIGVRGTDFVSGLDAQRAYALLLEGAIVLSGNTCQSNCTATLITEARTLATVDRQGLVKTRLITPAEVDRLIGAQKLTQAGNTEPRSSTGSDNAANSGNNNSNSTGNSSAMSVVGMADTHREISDRITLPAGNQRPATPHAAPPELVWTRWLATGRQTETFVVDASQFSPGADYKLRVTNLNYALWRRESEGTNWQPGVGSVNFKISQSAARFSDGFYNLPVNIEKGSLTLGFTDRTFATQLTGRLATDTPPRGLESLSQSTTLLNVKGTVSNDGRLTATTNNGNVFGLVSHDKQSAAYLFKAPAANGVVEGITQWQR